MDDTTKSIIDKITVNYPKPVQLPSGHKSSVFFDCIQLSPNDLARLAAAATGHLDTHAFDLALGVAYGGIFYAAAVAGGRHVAIFQRDGVFRGPEIHGQKVIVCGDVVCSGGELRKAADKVEEVGGKVIGYACIVDRSDGSVGTADCPLWSAYRNPL